MTAGALRLRRNEAVLAALLGTLGTLAAFVPGVAPKLGAAALACLGAGLWWIIAEPNRWIPTFIVAAWVLPPFPLDLGSSGPHVAVLAAACGVLCGLLRLPAWKIQIDWASTIFLLLVFSLAVSSGVAFLTAGSAIGLGSIARVLLFAIGVYAFLYVRNGPFEYSPRATAAVVRTIFWSAAVSSLVACVDFYYQLPALGNHSQQFIWLSTGMFRRAQGVFYESSTLGNLCAFALSLVAVALIRKLRFGIPVWALLSGSISLVAALVLSYSRGSLISLMVALITLVLVERRRISFLRLFGLAVPFGAAASALILYWVPGFAQAAWLRVTASLQFFLESPNAVLSGRLENWRILTRFLIENPLVAFTGIGYKTIPFLSIGNAKVIADNTYLNSLVETGVLGLVCVLALNVMILRSSYLALRSSDSTRAFLGAWMFCFWAGQTVQMLSGDLLTYWRLLPAYFCVLALTQSPSRSEAG